MPWLLYVATHGPDDPTMARVPLPLAVNGAAEARLEVEGNPTGDAAAPILDQDVNTLTRI